MKTLFRVAAAWNLGAAGAALAMPALFYSLVYRYEAPIAAPLLSVHRILWLFILVFGVGYWLVSRDFAAYRGIVVLGALGKTVIALYWLGEFALGTATVLIVAGALGDLVFVALFVRALRLEVP